MTELKRYRNLVFDNSRWTGFRFRDGDIVCDVCIRHGRVRPAAGGDLPWLDMQANELAAVVVALEAQEHRRLIKTHTPLDGLPLDGRVTYLCVGRDPRDAVLSFEHHMANLDWDVFMAARSAAVGISDLEEPGPRPEPPSADPVERFWQWA